MRRLPDGIVLVGSVCFARIELRSPTAILARLAVTSWTAAAGDILDARLEPTVLATAYGGCRVLALASPLNPGFKRVDQYQNRGARI